MGKTHLGVSLGLKAIEAGYRVPFTSAADLIERLTRAHADKRLEDEFKLYTVPRLLVDEIGYLPIDRVGANLFFRLISKQSFDTWGDVSCNQDTQNATMHADARTIDTACDRRRDRTAKLAGGFISRKSEYEAN